MHNLELRQLRCLVTLAEERNFGRAAARLYMSQPPLTRMLSEVERTVGAKLFDRTTRRVELTPTGEVFIAEAREVLARAGTAWEAVQAAIRRQAGQVRLAYTPLALQTLLPTLLSAFREREHDARVDLVGLTGEALHTALLAGQVDLAFDSEPIREPGFRNVLLHREPLLLMIPEGHRLAGHCTISLAMLEHDPLILHARNEYPAYYDRVLAAFRASGIDPNIVHREPGQNCAALVVGGQGALLTSGPHNRIPAHGLHLIALETSPLYEEIWGIWLDDRLSHPARTLAGIVQSQGIDGLR